MSRTKEQMRNAKKLLKKPAGELLPVDLQGRNTPHWMTRAFRNNRYTVMIDDNAHVMGCMAIKAMVQRHDDKPIPGHWRKMQNIKNELFGSEATAIEFYPPESTLVDKHNVYWMWVLPPGACISRAEPEETLQSVLGDALAGKYDQTYYPEDELTA